MRLSCQKTDWGAKGATGGAQVESREINSPIRTPFGGHFLHISTQILKKDTSNQDLQKSDEKVPGMVTPEPQKVDFRLRGASISTNPANLQKVIQKCPKGLHLDASFH